jgi:hypothetical protein
MFPEKCGLSGARAAAKDDHIKVTGFREDEWKRYERNVSVAADLRIYIPLTGRSWLSKERDWIKLSSEWFWFFAEEELLRSFEWDTNVNCEVSVLVSTRFACRSVSPHLSLQEKSPFEPEVACLPAASPTKMQFSRSTSDCVRL